MSIEASPVVLFSELPASGKKKVGIATLNRPDLLNGLSLAMCEQLDRQLRLWAHDSDIALVVLRGAGDRAFCAGGDLHNLYRSMRENVSGRPWDNIYARNFFAKEYRLDYLIHTYSKPLLCWGSGIVMGGGVGLMMGASHRVVSETTRYAMPEIKIGIFPDVGGSWMLGRLPEGVGLFLALTGAQLNASDCRHLGLADYCLQADRFDDMLAAIQSRSWSGERPEDDIRLHHILKALCGNELLPAGPLQTRQSLINEYCRGPDFDAICTQVAEWASNGDAWLAQAAHTFLKGSPGSARLGFTLQKMARGLSLADTFRLEYVVALQCVAMGDFKEGVRALLVDKDQQPAWNPASLGSASHEWVQRFFVAPWPETSQHPLADLDSCAMPGLPDFLQKNHLQAY